MRLRRAGRAGRARLRCMRSHQCGSAAYARRSYQDEPAAGATNEKIVRQMVRPRECTFSTVSTAVLLRDVGLPLASRCRIRLPDRYRANVASGCPALI
jgi:hypothetical protein